MLMPLVELFDTGLRSVMGVDLDNLLQKICSPWEPCLLRLKVFSSEATTSTIEPYRAPMLCASLDVRFFSSDFIPLFRFHILSSDFVFNYQLLKRHYKSIADV